MSYFDNSQKRRADHYEALWVGTSLGAAKSIKNLNARSREDHEKVEAFLSNAIGVQVNFKADRDALRALLKAIVEELKNPEMVKKFSKPDADLERGILLQETYKQSWESTIAEVKTKNQNTLQPKAIENSKKRAFETITGYKDEALAAQKDLVIKKASNRPS